MVPQTSWTVAYRISADGVRLSVHRPSARGPREYGTGHGDRFTTLKEAVRYAAARGYLKQS